MKNFLIFISGCIVGAIATFYVINNDVGENTAINEQTINESTINESKVQHIEIRGKKGDVILHTGMTKDSVKILVGKPDEVSLHSIGNNTHEKWGYKIRNKYVSDLDIDFKDGKLEGVQQRNIWNP